MKEIVKTVNLTGYGNKKHQFSVEKFSIAGHTFFHVLKNGNIILNCVESEFNKLKDLFDL